MITGGSTITFGVLPLLTPAPTGTDYSINVSATEHGTDWGNPEAVVAAVFSRLTDGDRAKITRFGNRQITIRVKIAGANLDIVAAGEEALMGEVNRGRNTLTLIPAGVTTASVFDVIYSDLRFDHDDAAAARGEAYATLTLTCLPFARRDTVTTVVAEPIPDVAPDVDVLDDGTSLDGWAATEGTLSVVSGAVRCTSSQHGPVRFTRSGLAAAVADDGYVVVDIQTSAAPGPIDIEMRTSTGSLIATDIVAADTTAINRRRWYLSPGVAATVASVTVATDELAWIAVHEVSTTDQLPYNGTRRQRSLVATVGGTARTQANVRVELADPTGAAKDFLLFTAPVNAAIAPPLRTWLSDSEEVDDDDTMVSGARQSLASPSVYTIPAANIPRGMHLIVAKIARTAMSSTETVTWTATVDSTYATDATDDSGSITALFSGGGAIYQLGIANLPSVALPDTTTANVVLTISGVADLLLDEVWLFNLDTGVLTWIDGINEMPSLPTSYEARSATIDSPRPDWRAGTAGTDADDISVANRARSAGVHEFTPGQMYLFVVTPGSFEQTVTVDYHERFQHHVSPPAA